MSAAPSRLKQARAAARSAEAPTLAVAFAYVGNETDAAGFRLAGVRASAPRAGEEAAAFRAATEASEAVFITGEIAAQLPRAVLDAALMVERPLLVLISDAGAAIPLDPAARVRAQLGLEG